MSHINHALLRQLSNLHMKTQITTAACCT